MIAIHFFFIKHTSLKFDQWLVFMYRSYFIYLFIHSFIHLFAHSIFLCFKCISIINVNACNTMNDSSPFLFLLHLQESLRFPDVSTALVLVVVTGSMATRRMTRTSNLCLWFHRSLSPPRAWERNYFACAEEPRVAADGRGEEASLGSYFISAAFILLLLLVFCYMLYFT